MSLILIARSSPPRSRAGHFRVATDRRGNTPWLCARVFRRSGTIRGQLSQAKVASYQHLVTIDKTTETRPGRVPLQGSVSRRLTFAATATSGTLASRTCDGFVDGHGADVVNG